MKLEDITSFEEKHKYLEENLQDDMYVRTSDNGIDKFKFKFKNDGKPFYTYYFEKTSMTNPESYIVKEPSYNIIDLIEENDYINGLRVEKNKYGELYTSYVYYGGDIGKMCEVYTTWLKEYKEDEIYSIVTKEQFSQMEYKVVE